MSAFFFDRQLWLSAVLQPLEIQRPIIPHLKGLMSGYCLVTLLGEWQCFLGLPRPLKVPLLYFIYRRSVHIHFRKLYVPFPTVVWLSFHFSGKELWKLWNLYSVIPIKRTVLLNVLFEKSGDRTVWFYYCYVLPIKRTVLKVRRSYCLITLLLCTSY